jgi:hypothetical protein
MVAIMKELHIKQDDNASNTDSIDMLERDRNNSLKRK